MQTFLPHSSFKDTFKVLDYKRLGKQRVEAHQILNILLDRTETRGWRSHPIVKMWTPYVDSLKYYTNVIIDEWVSRGYNNNMKKYKLNFLRMKLPVWLGKEEFHASHRANLLRKDYEHYSQFGWKENPKSPYVWLDADHKRWYEHYTNNNTRVYL